MRIYLYIAKNGTVRYDYNYRPYFLLLFLYSLLLFDFPPFLDT